MGLHTARTWLLARFQGQQRPPSANFQRGAQQSSTLVGEPATQPICATPTQQPETHFEQRLAPRDPETVSRG